MKKLIVLIVALTFIITALNISAFATSEPSAMTSKEYYTAQSYLIDKWCNGDITYSQYQEQSQAVTNEFVNTNTVGGVVNSGVLTVSNTFNGVSQKIGKAVDDWGDEAQNRVKDWWNDVCNKNNVPSETTQTSTMDMYGYGACVVYSYAGGTSYRYCKYIVFDSETGKVTSYAPFQDLSIYSSGSFWGSVSYSNVTWEPDIIALYGDVRYKDGTQAPTDDVFEYDTIKNFDDMSQKELEDLFNDFSEEIERQNPDLLNIEGLLNAIYARMGTLDSDNDNDLLASINANILALLEADNKKNEDEDNTNEELIKTLLEIRDSLKNGTLGTAPEAHGHEISGTVYNVIPLDKEWLDNMIHKRTNLKVNYQGTTYYLEDCGCLKLGDKYYTPNMNYEEYSADYYNIDDLPSFTFDSTYTYSNGDVQTYSMARDGLPPVDEFLEAGNSVIQPFIDKAVNEMAKAFTIGIPYDDIKNSTSIQTCDLANAELRSAIYI